MFQSPQGLDVMTGVHQSELESRTLMYGWFFSSDLVSWNLISEQPPWNLMAVQSFCQGFELQDGTHLKLNEFSLLLRMATDCAARTQEIDAFPTMKMLNVSHLCYPS